MPRGIDEPPNILGDDVAPGPGNVPVTGSPSGSVGMQSGRRLRPGDRIHAEIEGIGIPEVGVDGHA